MISTLLSERLLLHTVSVGRSYLKRRRTRETDPLHPLFQQEPAVKRLKSRKSFLHLVEPLQASPHNRSDSSLSLQHLQNAPHNSGLDPKESLPSGSVRHGPFGYVLTAWELQQVDRTILSCRGGGYEIYEATCDCGEEQTYGTSSDLPSPPDSMYFRGFGSPKWPSQSMCPALDRTCVATREEEEDLRNTYIFQVSNYIFIYIQSMQFPVITYGMALYINDSYVYRQKH